MRMLVDRRDELGRARTQTVNRIHRLLLELFPGGAKKCLSVTQAWALVATTRPRDIAGKTRRQLGTPAATSVLRVLVCDDGDGIPDTAGPEVGLASLR